VFLWCDPSVQSLTTPGSWESPGCLTAKNFSKATGKRTHLLPVTHGSYSLPAASALRLRLAASVVRGVAAPSCLQWPLAPLRRSGPPPAPHSNAHLGSAPVHLRLTHAAEPPENARYGDTRSEGPFPQHSAHRNSIQKSVYCWVVVRKFLDGSI
jgi:hypothetical protein